MARKEVEMSIQSNAGIALLSATLALLLAACGPAGTKVRRQGDGGASDEPRRELHGPIRI